MDWGKVRDMGPPSSVHSWLFMKHGEWARERKYTKGKKIEGIHKKEKRLSFVEWGNFLEDKFMNEKIITSIEYCVTNTKMICQKQF